MLGKHCIWWPQSPPTAKSKQKTCKQTKSPPRLIHSISHSGRASSFRCSPHLNFAFLLCCVSTGISYQLGKGFLICFHFYYKVPWVHQCSIDDTTLPKERAQVKLHLNEPPWSHSFSPLCFVKLFQNVTNF